ncbi:MAG: triose-phosphate isomerase [Chlorobi bacterium]|nr:triose-phosphate isomerase [Chlorobiota bacterium]
MRKRIIAGNWKMNKNLSESIGLISELKSKVASKPENVDVLIFPPYTSLETASALTKDSSIKLGAQNMHQADGGAFTGEISAGMLKSVGCEFVILGHSERRHIFGESDELINEKIKKALEEDLKPVFCIGETLEQREAGITNDVIRSQVEKGLNGVTENQLNEVIIAYEPVWAIGTGKTASPEQAEEVHKFIRELIETKYSSPAAEKVIILYGGSVKPENAATLLAEKDIDGALVGGACLKADSFAGIINA